MKIRCDDCQQIFDENEMKTCEFHFSGEKKVVTKYGVQYEKTSGRFCKGCIALKHKHEGDVWM